MIVTVRFCSGVQCNDLEISDGTDAMYEMETFETRTKVWIRYKPYRHYIKWGGLAQLARASALHAEGHRFDSDILHICRSGGMIVVQLLDVPQFQKGGESEMDIVWVINPSTGTLWAKVIKPQRETDVSHSLKQVGDSTPAYFLLGVQLSRLEQMTHNHQVSGSSPGSPTIKFGKLKNYQYIY